MEAVTPTASQPAAAPIDIRDHVALVHWALKRGRFERYVRGALTYDDLAQAGMLGLHRAAQDFDPARGCTFATYALIWVRQQIRRELQNKGSTIRVPVHRLQSRQRAGQRWWPSVRSLDKPLSTDPNKPATLADILPDTETPAPDAELEHKDSAAQLAELCAKARLTEREQHVLTLRTRDVAFEDIAAELGLSRERARQIERGALAKLRKAAGSDAKGSIANACGTSRRRRAA